MYSPGLIGLFGPLLSLADRELLLLGYMYCKVGSVAHTVLTDKGAPIRDPQCSILRCSGVGGGDRSSREEILLTEDGTGEHSPSDREHAEIHKYM